jgi:hypothetical protein
MKLYQSPDGVWTGTQADAKAHAREAGVSWREVEVPTDKAGLMAFLNEHRVGAKQPNELASVVPQATASPAQGYTHSSVALDEAWQGLSLARKLHFSALAMEEARLKL